METNIIINGNSLDELKKLPAESINCCVTSPPYWGLRSYGKETEQIWDAKVGCEHDWNILKQSARGGIGENSIIGENRNSEANNRGHPTISNICQKCGAWKGQLGLEPIFDDEIIELFELRTDLTEEEKIFAIGELKKYKVI